MCFAAGKTYTFLLTCSKVTRPLIESHITPLVIPPELQTSKTVKPAVCFFSFKGQEPINTCSGAIHF